MPETTPPHVLALNDSEEVLAVLKELLEEEAGYRVTTMTHLLKDLGAIRADPPDLVILDYMWAEEGAGWSMLQLLRMDRATAKTPIVLCTGAKKAVEELGDRLAEQNVRVVMKPFDIDELLEVVATALGGPAV